MRIDSKLSVDGKLRRSFHTEGVTIDVEEDIQRNGGIRLIERGRGYVKVLLLYEEELQWLQMLCWKERRKNGGFLQLGCLRGGRRTLICSRILVGHVRKLELRLFAPYGRRQMCIPEIAARQDWFFFAELMSNFIPRKETAQPIMHPNYKRNFPLKREEAFPLREWGRRKAANVQPQKSSLQAASLSKWSPSGVRSSYIDGNVKSVVVNFEDAVERSFQRSSCLVGSIGGSMQENEDFAAVKKWVDRSWRIPGGVAIKELDPNTFLFIFPSRELAEEKIGKYSVNGRSLFLDRWHSWSCCNRRGWNQNSTWIRVLGLPVFLWDKGIFESIGEYCGGYLETAEETINQAHLMWA